MMYRDASRGEACDPDVANGNPVASVRPLSNTPSTLSHNVLGVFCMVEIPGS